MVMDVDIVRVRDPDNGFFLIKFCPTLVSVLHDDSLGFLVFFVMMSPILQILRVED